jgi:hypothetical protein
MIKRDRVGKCAKDEVRKKESDAKRNGTRLKRKPNEEKEQRTCKREDCREKQRHETPKRWTPSGPAPEASSPSPLTTASL